MDNTYNKTLFWKTNLSSSGCGSHLPVVFLQLQFTELLLILKSKYLSVSYSYFLRYLEITHQRIKSLFKTFTSLMEGLIDAQSIPLDSLCPFLYEIDDWKIRIFLFLKGYPSPKRLRQLKREICPFFIESFPRERKYVYKAPSITALYCCRIDQQERLQAH